MTAWLPQAGADPVRDARARLTEALQALQRITNRPPDLELALDHVAGASSALFSAEAAGITEAIALSHLRTALDALTRALDLLHARPTFIEGLDKIASAVAQALALLYPRVRMSERQRRGVVPPDGIPSLDRRALVALADRIDAARGEETPGTERLGEQRLAGQRVHIEVDVGVLSASNFYAGVAADVSTGGVFVSTPKPLAVGTEVALYFTLDGGRLLQAEGTVRWTRGDGGAPPGMGVAFARLKQDDQRAIADFCANRPPLFHD